jgi:chorismate lyase / 3-hydroxybenzoate synthase
VVRAGSRPDRKARGVDFAHSSKVLFGHVRQISVEDDPERDAYDLYHRVFELVAELGYPHVCRMWNYLPDINGERAGLERYRLFCRGRHRALAEALRPFEPALPAASAIGTRTPGLLVCFLAAAPPGEQVENPRQVSAFRYPAQYGPKSPSFSRSILKSWGAGHHHLYISGMASIVGHATRHIGDFERQLKETCDNLESLMEAANGRCGERLRLDRLRVYLRDGGRAAQARAAIAARLGPVPMLILQGDLCRADLLLEVEGLAIGEAAAAGATETKVEPGCGDAGEHQAALESLSGQLRQAVPCWRSPSQPQITPATNGIRPPATTLRSRSPSRALHLGASPLTPPSSGGRGRGPVEREDEGRARRTAANVTPWC